MNILVSKEPETFPNVYTFVNYRNIKLNNSYSAKAYVGGGSLVPVFAADPCCLLCFLPHIIVFHLVTNNLPNFDGVRGQ